MTKKMFTKKLVKDLRKMGYEAMVGGTLRTVWGGGMSVDALVYNADEDNSTIKVPLGLVVANENNLSGDAMVALGMHGDTREWLGLAFPTKCDLTPDIAKVFSEKMIPVFGSGDVKQTAEAVQQILVNFVG